MNTKRLLDLYTKLSKGKKETSILNRMLLSLYAHYGELTRYYHTISHINNCLAELDRVKEYVNLKAYPEDYFDIIEYAIWYHDIVMFTKPGQSVLKKSYTNERLSADRAYLDGLMLRIPKPFLNEVFNLILMTEHNVSPSLTKEMTIIDIDLSVLGYEKTSYDLYSNKIRQEYKEYDNITFWKGRIDVLDKFLKRPSIYYTEFFRNRYESQARTNLISELASLKFNLVRLQYEK